MIIRHSKFSSNSFGDGGAKRSAQIEEILQRGDVEYINETFCLPKNLNLGQLIRLSLRAAGFIHKYVGWSHYPSIKTKLDAIKYFALRIPIVVDKYRGQDICFLWESTVSDNYGYLYLMKAINARIIAIPHNLESVVPTQIDTQTKKEAPFWLLDEISRLKECDAVFTISKEENWLLRLFGVSSSYLPYVPPVAAYDYLIGIRNRRSNRPENDCKKYLLLGSATNPPTRQGMQLLLDKMAQNNLSFELYVAGYGTDSIQTGDNKSIHHLGPVSADELERMLLISDALLVYQPPTSGALTRIIEMLLAGIPVFVNFDAARNYYDVGDVIVYKDVESLFELLTHFSPHLAKMPIMDQHFEMAFIDTIRDSQC